MKYSKTQKKILDTASALIQERGYNAFSYKDIAEIIDIKTSSIHYYYASKENLAIAVLDMQIENFDKQLNEIYSKNVSVKNKITLFINLIISNTYKNHNKMCLGGMFAADLLSLPDAINNKVKSFFNHLQKWIIKVLKDSVITGDSKKQTSPYTKYAKQILIKIEGALLLARLYNDESFLNYIKEDLNL